MATSGLHKGAPHAALTEAQHKTGGRNHHGRITTRHIGGGHKQHYRLIDFKRDKEGIPARVERVEYDPNRTAHIALLCYVDGERRYIIAPKGVAVGDQLIAGRDAPIKNGNSMPLRNVPDRLDRALHRDASRQGCADRAQRRCIGPVDRARAGLRHAAPALRRDAQGAGRLPRHDRRSRQRRAQPAQDRQGGRQALEGISPTVRGAAMNPVDHPHGGGEGRAGQGNPHPVSPWGMPTKGYKTRKNKRTQKFIVRDRRS